MNPRVFTALVALFLTATAMLSRLIDHPANFIAAGAVAMVAAYYLESRYSWLIPVASMFLADLFLGFYDLRVMAAVYGSYALIWGLGRLARKARTRTALLPAMLIGSISHFAVTNFAVWAFSGMYAKTAAGLALSYGMAIPFFKWTLAGDLFYGILLVGAIETAGYMARKVRLNQAVSPTEFNS